MEVIDIVKKYLEDNGFDGLFLPGECGCVLDDLAPCGSMCEGCEAGYKHIQPPGSEYDFIMRSDKPHNKAVETTGAK